MSKIFALLFLLAAATAAAADDTYLCTRVLHGDTLELDDGRTVRLIGVTTPTIPGPHEPAEWFANEAYWYAKGLVEGKRVSLKLGLPRKDKYDRTLAYVYLMDGTCINAEIILQGYGYADRGLFRYRGRYIDYEEIAREWKKGVWNEEGKQFFEAREKLRMKDPAGYEASVLGNYEASRRLGVFDRKGRAGDIYIVEPGTGRLIYKPESEPENPNTR